MAISNETFIVLVETPKYFYLWVEFDSTKAIEKRQVSLPKKENIDLSQSHRMINERTIVHTFGRITCFPQLEYGKQRFTLTPADEKQTNEDLFVYRFYQLDKHKSTCLPMFTRSVELRLKTNS